MARLIVTLGGDYLLRMRSWARQTLRAGRGCAISRPREVRCAGRGVTRVNIRLGDGRSNSFSGQGLRVPITIVGGPGSDFIDLGGLSGTEPVVGATAGATIDTGAGSDSAAVVARGGDYVLRGGRGRDSLGVQTVPGTPASSIELLGGDGDDHLAGGPASDRLTAEPVATSSSAAAAATTSWAAQDLTLCFSATRRRLTGRRTLRSQ